MSPRTRMLTILTAMLAIAAAPLLAAGQSGQHAFGTPEFQQVWEQTDLPVEQGMESRTWIWGPGANTPLMEEPYAEGDNGFRTVQYTDKSRMEMPVHPIDPGSDWFITQGLLATELMTGNLQLGDATFVQHDPSDAFVAGDPGNNQSPTYAQMGELMDEPSRTTGETITDVIASDGSISSDGSLAAHGVTAALHVGETDHTIASVFWDFMNSSGTVYSDGQFGHGPVFNSPFYAIGFPITEAYWGHVTVAGTPQMVLTQCFQRRCLTFTPDNDPGWQVESGNIGQHYYDWRYNQPHYPDDDATDDTPPVSDDGTSDDTPPATGDDSLDDSAPPSNPEMLIVHPDQSVAEINISYTFTVEVLDGDLEPYPGAQVQAQVTETTGATGAHLNDRLTPDPATTGLDGFAELNFTGTEQGVDTITFDVLGTDLERTAIHAWTKACVSEGQSIQESLDVLLPGGSLCIEPGEYGESLHIETDFLSITGMPGATLTGSGPDNDIGVTIDARHVSVEGMSIEGFESKAILVNDSTDISIADMEIIAHNDGVAIDVWNSAGTSISDTEIEKGDSARGAIAIQDSHEFQIQDVNIGAGSGDGIWIFKSSDGEIHNTRIGDAGGSAIGLGGDIQHLAITDNTVSDSRSGIFMNHEDGTGAGMHFVTIHGNRFEDNVAALQVQSRETHDMSIRDNIFLRNDFALWIGEHAHQADRLVIRDNDFLNNMIGADNQHADLTVDAKENFWGSASGPDIEGQSGPGDGETVRGAFDVDPWDTFPNARQ